MDNNEISIVCISDTHTHHQKIKELPSADILIHAGDFTYSGQDKEINSFANWLDSLSQYKYKIVIAGNHDLTLDQKYQEAHNKSHQNRSQNISRLKASCIYLENESVEILGLKIYGSPYSPEFCNWAFSIQKGQESKEMWSKIPKDTDILITHGPPYKILDKTITGIDAGCIELLNTVQDFIKPKYHIFGHIHEGYGIHTFEQTTYINCSICTIRYRPTNEPVFFQIYKK